MLLSVCVSVVEIAFVFNCGITVVSYVGIRNCLNDLFFLLARSYRAELSRSERDLFVELRHDEQRDHSDEKKSRENFRYDIQFSGEIKQ